MFRYDRRLKDNPEVKELVSQAWKSASNTSANDKINVVLSALIQWSKQQYQNSREKIEQNRLELESTLTDQRNDTELITRVSN